VSSVGVRRYQKHGGSRSQLDSVAPAAALKVGPGESAGPGPVPRLAGAS